MCSIAIKIPDEVLYDTKMTKDEANAFAKKATALMLYLKNQIKSSLNCRNHQNSTQTQPESRKRPGKK